MTKYTTVLLILFAFASCARKIQVNESGFDRPVKKNVFSYSKRFTHFPPQIDTNAIYVHSCQFETSGGMRLQYGYFRFFSGGQVLYSVADSKLDLTHLDDLNKGIIGRYYVKNDRLHMQLFYRVNITYSISKFSGYFEGDTLFIFETSNTPGSWCTVDTPGRLFKKSAFKWEKQKVTFKSIQAPGW
jgi:hypothetical protein